MWHTISWIVIKLAIMTLPEILQMSKSFYNSQLHSIHVLNVLFKIGEF